MGEELTQPSPLPGTPPSRPLTTLERPALSVSYSKCVELYKRFLALLGKQNCRIIRLEQANVGKILEEYGRLQIWGEQTRAALPERTRGSLDDAIRNDDSLRDAVDSILMQLSRHLSMAIPIAEKSYDDSTQESESSMTTDSDPDSDSQLDSDRDGDRSNRVPSHRCPRVSKISVILNLAFEQIQLLYRFSLLLDRPGLSGRYLRSINKNREDLKLSHFAEFDYMHICEKIRQWKRKPKAIADEKGEEETATTAEDMKERKLREPPASDEMEILCRRLAESNTRRREQFQYWTRFPDRPDVVQSRNITNSSETDPIFAQARAEAKSVATKSQTSTVKPAEQETAMNSRTSKSMTSRQSFSTVAMSDVFNNQTNAAPQTIYAQSPNGNRSSNRVPDVPTAAKMGPTFKCPYCNLTLDSQVMVDRLSWKRHVFRDLRPYVCTFPNCLNPQKQYLNRRDWIYHEQQMHRRQWVCSGDCQQKFPTKDLMMKHVRIVHSSTLAQHQLPIMIQMSERPIDEDQILACPLCPDEIFLSRLQNHLAEHLETISLFVLPNQVDQDEDTDSYKAIRTGSEPDQNEICSQATLSSLGFSQADEKDQTKEDFSKLLAMEEAKFDVKCETWKAGEAVSAVIQESNTADTSTIKPSGEEKLKNLIRMANKASNYRDQGRWIEAARLCLQIMKTNSRILGAEHPDTLVSITNLALTYRKLGNLKEAKELDLQVMRETRRVLGAELPETLTRMRNLASTYRDQGETNKAIELEVQILKARKKALGVEHSDTLISMIDLASTYEADGRLDEAEELKLEVMETRKDTLGTQHLDTLSIMASLASTYWKQGKLKEASELGMQVMEVRKTVLGADHPQTLVSIDNYAQMLNDQGEYEEAEKIIRQTLTLLEKLLGKDHPNTLMIMNSLTTILNSQKKYEKAEKIIRQTLTLQKKLLGKNHPDTLMIMSNLATVLNNQEKYEEAEEMNRQTLMTMSNLATVLNSQEKYEEAEEMDRQTLALQEKLLGKDHPDTLMTMSNLTKVLNNQKKYEAAEKIIRQTLTLQEKLFLKNHPDTLMTMNNLAKVLNNQKKYEKEEEIIRQTIPLLEEELGNDHPHTLATMNYLRELLIKKGKYEEAKSLWDQILTPREKVLKKENTDTLKSMHVLAIIFDNQEKYEEAEAMYRETLMMKEKRLGKTHPDTLCSMDSLAVFLNERGQYDEAEALFRQVLSLREDVLGKEHFATRQSMTNLKNIMNNRGKLI